ncbi:MAG: hypothetical protein ACRCX2_13515 [Paraclostridium sp.]
MKKIIMSISILSILVGGLFLNIRNNNLSTRADFPAYESIDSIVDKSDDIILGVVVQENRARDININLDKDDNEEVNMVYTTFNVEILDVIKGDLKIGDIIEVKQLGDKYGVSNYDVKKAGYFKNNQENIFFLSSYKNLNPDMPYSTLNPSQGHLEIDNNQVKTSSKNNLFAESFNKEEIINILKNKVK